jgi:ribokinase
MIVATGPSFHDLLLPVPHLPRPGEYVTGSDATAMTGGGVVATAAWASTLGGRTAVVTSADGSDGQRLRRTLNDSGVAAAYLPGETVRCLVMLTPDGERTMVNQQPPPEPAALTQGAEALLADAQVSWCDWSDDATAGAVHAASTAPLRGISLRLLRRELEQGRSHEVVIGSRASGAVPAADELAQSGCRVCVVTDGNRGGSYWDGGPGWHTFQAAPLPGAFVDSCGAGDAFVAGVLTALARGSDCAGAVALGAATAAACCCQPGSFPAG